MLKRIFIFLSLVFGLNRNASFASDSVIFNEVLFQVQDQVYTAFDEKQFLAAYKNNPIRFDFVKLIKNEREVFILSRLLMLQLNDSLDQVEKVKKNVEQFKVFVMPGSSDLFQAEVILIQSINESQYSKLKDNFTSERLDAWVGYLKKKYIFTNLN